MENMNNNKTSNQKDSPKVSIVILNWNNWKDTLECLDSLYRIQYPNWDLFLVDNGSEDESISMLKKWVKGEITAPHAPMIQKKP